MTNENHSFNLFNIFDDFKDKDELIETECAEEEIDNLEQINLFKIPKYLEKVFNILNIEYNRRYIDSSKFYYFSFGHYAYKAHINDF